GTRVPVEDNGVAGTTRSHWKETVFNDELMTGYISGTVHPLSLTTVESMADLGYTVDPTAADPFNLATSTAIRAGQAATGFWLVNDVIRVPRRYVDERTGQVVPGPTH
ncbi:MAG TPA: leishmanolysin-related zinc metalloendopeptidase, partial [Gemmatimonadales bacterium]|nr:leishmanolysin-related zinc metalloendopeptidase [Gemmatimonadales bacterium]